MLKPTFDLFAPGAVEELIAFNRSVFGDLRMEGEGDGDSDPKPDPKPTPAAAPAAPSTGDRGFPENTPLTEMSADQRESYWKFQARKHQERAEQRADRDELKAKADEYDRLKAESQTEQEKAVAAARAEGAAQALRTANERAARAILRSSLAERGKTADEVEAIVGATNLSAFVVDDDVDTVKVGAHVDLLAPRVALQQQPRPDLGQGRREVQKTTGSAVGADLFAQRRKRVAP
jgi:Skp family chaperone for outer membrane proteins